MSLFEKCYRFTKAREVIASGYYPYFQPIEASYDTEVLIRGEKKIMVTKPAPRSVGKARPPAKKPAPGKSPAKKR